MLAEHYGLRFKPAKNYGLTYKVIFKVIEKEKNRIRYYVKEGNGFTSVFATILYFNFSGATSGSYTGYSSSLVSPGNYYTYASVGTYFGKTFTSGTDWYLMAPAGNQVFGILISSSTATPVPGDVTPGSLLLTNWTYDTMQFIGITISGANTVQSTFQRVFTNTATTAQTVNAVNLGMQVAAPDATYRWVLVAHDLLPGQPINVPAGAALAVQYVFQTSY